MKKFKFMPPLPPQGPIEPPSFAEVFKKALIYKKMIQWKQGITLAGASILTAVGLYLASIKGNETKMVQNTIAPPSVHVPKQNALPVVSPAAHLSNEIAGTPNKEKISFQVYTVNADQDIKIITPAGTEINIPKNALANEHGVLVKGEVQVMFREFMDVADILLAGIPMTYDSAGLRRHFQSAGMFEIQATQHGKKLMLKKDAKVWHASKWNGTLYNQYYMPTQHGKWKYIKNAQVQNLQKEDLYYVHANALGFRNLFMDKVNDSTSYKLLKKSDNKPDGILFQVVADEKKFPELKPFKDNLFKSIDPVEINLSYLGRLHNIIDIEKTEVEGVYRLILLDANGPDVYLDCQPVIKRGDSLVVDEKAKEKYFQMTKTKSSKNIPTRTVNRSLSFQGRMTFNEYKTLIDRQVAINISNEKVLNVFIISQFGFYNSDNPLAMPKGFNINVSMKDHQGNAIQGKGNLILADRDINAVYTIAPTAKGTHQFSLSPYGNYIATFIDHQGKMWYTPGPLQANEQTKELVMQELKDGPIQALKNQLLF